jgi:predicted O-linked N-acetylglucosamine transferase (SPINDLY family)
LTYKDNKNFLLINSLVQEKKFFEARELLLKDKNKYLLDYFFIYILGFLEDQLGNSNQAISNYLESVRLNPSFKESKFSLGSIYYKLRKLDEAKLIFLDLIEETKDIRSYHNLALILFDQTLYDDSILYLKIASNLYPTSYEVHHQLGLVYSKLKKYYEAIKYYDLANKFNEKKDSSTLNNLGNVYSDLKDYDRAIFCYNQALKFDGDKSKIYNNLAVAYSDIGDLEKTIYCYEQSLLLNSKNLIIRQRYIFYLLYNFETKKLYKQETIKYSEEIDYLPNLSKINKLKNFTEDRQINLGIVSGDFRKHPVGYFLMDILNHLKNENIKLFAYSNPEIEDDYTESLKERFDVFNNISSLSDKDSAAKIYDDKIDILIDMSGFSNQTRLSLFKQKISPVQVSWAGWLATTGLKEIDYIVGDSIVTPETHKDYYVEKILQLPNIWCHLSTSDIKQIDTNHTPALINNYITFGCFNSMHKINNKVIEAWSEILHAVLNSKILIKNFQVNNYLYKKKIINEFKKNNILEDRLIFEEASLRDKLLLSYNNIDIALDTFPYTGGTTSLETAWMCVPLLTIRGDSFISRCGASINSNLNQDHWTAENVKQYIQLANEYASDYKKLDINRSYLRDNSRKSPIFNSKLFSKNFAKALRKILLEYVTTNNNI